MVKSLALSAAAIGAIIAVGAGATAVSAQRVPFDRLPRAVFDVVPPSARVGGAPGQMTIAQTSCRTLPPAEMRQRIVGLAVQEWGFFGFTLVDQAEEETDDDPGVRRFRRRLPPEEAARLAGSIAGYWTATPGGGWILENQNRVWNTNGADTRWRYPWSAAFVSWVMCEAGLASAQQFQRAIAHHVYIDQAIRARDTAASRAAFVAHDIGEAAITPGDLLCSGRRPAYDSLADRRRQTGEGARTHCDIVVKVDEAGRRILAIGGNVRGSVSLKVVPAIRDQGRWRPAKPSEESGARAIFAHLRLRVAPVEAGAFDASPTIRALACGDAAAAPARRAAAQVTTTDAFRCGA